MKEITIGQLSSRTKLNGEELAELIKSNFGDRAGGIEITKDTKIEEFPENLHGQVGLTVWAFT